MIPSDILILGGQVVSKGIFTGKPWKTLHCKDWMEVLVSFLLNRLGLSQLSKTPNEKEPECKPLYFNHQNMLSGSDFPSKAKWTPENNL